MALAFAVLDVTGSATDLGVVLAARTITLLLFFLAGGVWEDRLPRQRLMMFGNIATAFFQPAQVGLTPKGPFPSAGIHHRVDSTDRKRPRH